MKIDNNELKILIHHAKEAGKNAYAPYSKFQVGASIITESGDIFAGCNVENASFGLTMCAERNAIFQGVAKGHQKFTTLVLYTETKSLTPPCGACRQVIVEFFPQTAQIFAVNHFGDTKSWTVAQLLPDYFSSEHF